MSETGGTFVEFSESDLLRNKTVDPAWYVLHIDKVGVWTPTKDGQSNNIILSTTIVKDADTGSTEYAGVPIDIQFNSKPGARGFIEGFFRGGLGVEVEAGRYNFKEAEGMNVEAHIKNEPFEGRMKNKPSHQYRKIRA